MNRPPGPFRPVPIWRIVAQTWEWDGEAWVLVVRHELYGGTEERARQVLDAHLRSDRFLNACAPQGNYQGTTCWTDLFIEPTPGT